MLIHPRQTKKPSAREAVAAINLAVVAAFLLGTGCASAPPAAPPIAPQGQEATLIGDSDVQLSFTRLSREQVLTVLGPHGRRLSESATTLEVVVTAVSSPARLSLSSFRLRLPTGEVVEPLESKWVLAVMSLPGEAERSGGGTSWPVFDEPNDVGTAVLDIALVSILVLAVGVKALIDSSKSKPRLQARAAVWKEVVLPRTVERGATDRFLVVYWPRNGRVPAGIPLPLALQLELARCTWRAEVVIPAD